MSVFEEAIKAIKNDHVNRFLEDHKRRVHLVKLKGS